jgi:hypothetical protein
MRQNLSVYGTSDKLADCGRGLAADERGGTRMKSTRVIGVDDVHRRPEMGLPHPVSAAARNGAI